MSRSERDKGLRGEREVAAIYEQLGAQVRGLEGIGDHLIVTPGLFGPTLHSECKRQETARPWAWWAQASSEAPPGTMAVVHFRRSRSPWLAIVDAKTLAAVVCELAELRAEKLGGGGLPLVPGPTTYTTACTCDSRLEGYHRMDCGVYG